MNRFNDVISGMIERNIPFFLYRLPDEEKVLCGYQITPEIAKIKAGEMPLKTGYVFAPFKNKECYQIIPEEILDLNLSIDTLKEKTQTISFQVSSIESSSNQEIDYEHYLGKCAKYIDQIKKGRIEKAILSRMIKHPNLKKENAAHILSKLFLNYPSAYVFLVNLPGITTWIGATPEVLLKVRGTRFQTFSLAGTRLWKQNDIENPSSWSKKEINEQAIVTEYICQRIQSLNIQSLSCSELKVKKAGNMGHLLTEIAGDMEGSNVGSLLHVLHPTPAVCGSPRNEALTVIEELEGYSREFYAGYLGFVDHNGADLYVNLRCAKLCKDTGYLYVGGGITLDSDPIQEWNETCLKAQTILNVLN